MSTKNTKPEIPVCENCGLVLGQYIPGFGIICSSSYLGGPLCYECQVEHCLGTNCLTCQFGKWPECEHADLKKYYLNPDN